MNYKNQRNKLYEYINLYKIRTKFEVDKRNGALWLNYEFYCLKNNVFDVFLYRKIPITALEKLDVTSLLDREHHEDSISFNLILLKYLYFVYNGFPATMSFIDKNSCDQDYSDYFRKEKTVAAFLHDSRRPASPSPTRRPKRPKAPSPTRRPKSSVINSQIPPRVIKDLIKSNEKLTFQELLKQVKKEELVRYALNFGIKGKSMTKPVLLNYYIEIEDDPLRLIFED